MNSPKIAAVSALSYTGNVQDNLLITIDWIKKLDAQGVDFILFPELNLSGYIKDSRKLLAVCQLQKHVFETLMQLSNQTKAAFAVGFPEQDPQGFYISHFLFSKGRLIGQHRKTHLGPTEKDFFIQGNEIKVFQIGQLNIGIQLCFESHFPELSYIQTRQGANVLALAFASPRESPEEKLARFKRFLPARAYDNNTYVMACNLRGKFETERDFSGLACVIDPKGNLLTEDIAGACVASVDLSQIQSIKQSRMAFFNQSKRLEIFQQYYQHENK